MREFRVVDLRSDDKRRELTITATSPEDASARALGEKFARDNRNRGRPVCQVYWNDGGGRNTMIKLYARPQP